MTNQNSTSASNQVQASVIKHLRLIRTDERPNDVVLEITTGRGVEHFLLPKASVNDLAQKLAKIDSPAQKPVIQ